MQNSEFHPIGPDKGKLAVRVSCDKKRRRALYLERSLKVLLEENLRLKMKADQLYNEYHLEPTVPLEISMNIDCLAASNDELKFELWKRVKMCDSLSGISGPDFTVAFQIYLASYASHFETQIDSLGGSIPLLITTKMDVI